MTLFFDLDKLELHSKNDPRRFIDLLRTKHLGLLYLRYKVNLSGTSFILNPEPLFDGVSNQDIYYTIQYIKLAAKRDYTLYKEYQCRSLILSYYPDLYISNIKTNPLLKITKTEVLFIYEEEYKKETSKWH